MFDCLDGMGAGEVLPRVEIHDLPQAGLNDIGG